MKKLLVAAVMALGLGVGMGSAFAATTASHSARPSVSQWGPAYTSDFDRRRVTGSNRSTRPSWHGAIT